MRLRSLRLQNYGHLDDETIDLGPGATVVLGANEAGKSTFLDAVSDFLWGVRSQRHPRAFRYAPKSMHLVGSVEVDGKSHTYTRNLKSLKEAGKEVVPPWDPQGVRSAESWEAIFGLDLVRLQQGGRDILAGRGDLADLVFLAETGQALKRLRTDLSARMDAIFKDRKNAQCEVRTVIAGIARLEESLEDSEASAEDVTALRERIQDLEKQRREWAEELQSVGRTERRLNELTRCFPLAAQLRELEDELAELQARGRVLSPRDTQALDDAIRDRSEGQKRKVEIEGQMEARRQRKEQLPLKPDLVGAKDSIMSLQQSLDARREDQLTMAATDSTEARRDRVVGILRRLGRAPGIELSIDVDAVTLGDASRDNLSRLATAAGLARARADEQALEVQRLESEAQVTESMNAEDTELVQSRSDRDAAWEAVRSPWMSGDLPGAHTRQRMAESLDRAIVVADETAERMADQLEVAAQQRGQEEERVKQVTTARSELDRLEHEAQKAVMEWDQVATECSLPPGIDFAGWEVHDKLLTELAAAWQDFHRAEASMSAASQRWATFSEQVDALDLLPSSSPGDPILRVQKLEAALSEASNAQIRAEEIDQELSNLAIDLVEVERSLREAEQTITALSPTGDESPEDFLERCQGVLKQKGLVETKTEQLKGAKEPDSLMSELMREVEQADLETLKASWEEARARQAVISDEVKDVDAELGGCQKELSMLESRDSVAHIRAFEVTEGERLRSLVEEYRSLRLQVEMLDVLGAEITQSTDSPVLVFAGELLRRLTAGRYAGFEVVDEGESRHIEVLFSGSQPGSVEPLNTALEALSDGTADQVFLALRLAGIASRQDERARAGLPPLPVVLDDVLMAHDDARTRAALEVIAELGKGMQVILLTHHASVEEAAGGISGLSCVELRAVN